MNFQEKLTDLAQRVRSNPAAFASAAAAAARRRLEAGQRRMHVLRKSFDVLNSAGQEFGQVTRHHANRLMKQNSPLLAAAGKDISALARTTFRTLVDGKAPRQRSRRGTKSRSRTRKQG